MSGEMVDTENARLHLCRQLLGEHRIVGRHLRRSNWNHPSWIMLLELYLADAGGKLLSVSSLGYAAGVPTGSAVRLVAALDARGLVRRIPDPNDGRRTHVVILQRARTLVHCILDDCTRLRHSAP